MKGLQHTDRVEAYTQYYPTADRMFLEANSNATEIIAAVPALTKVKPYFLSNFPFMGKNYVASGTFQVFNEASHPYIGVLIRDTVSGDLAAYRTSGKHFLPVHASVTQGEYESISWVGKTAYLIVDGEDWGVTDNPDGSNFIAIGRFVDRFHFRPNGIKWWDRFAKVELDPAFAMMNSAITIEDNVVEGCCFGECRLSAFPIVKNANGKLVTIDAKAYSLNPIYEISRVEWCWTGQTETFVVGGDTITQAKTDMWTKGSTYTIPFDSYGTKTVTIRIFLEKDGECGCGCGDGSCCVVKEFVIDVQPSLSSVCINGSIGSGSGSAGGGIGVPTTNTYRVYQEYKDTDILIQDTVVGMVITGQGTCLFGTPVNIADTVALEGAIDTVLSSRGIGYENILVNYTAAPANDDKAVISVIISDCEAELVDLLVNIDGATPIVIHFELV